MKMSGRKELTGIILDAGSFVKDRAGDVSRLSDLETGRIGQQVADLRPLFEEILLVTNRVHAYSTIDAEVVGIIHPDRGIVGAIFSGLFYASHEAAFVGTSAMAFVDATFISYMIRRLEKYDMVVPASRHGLHPLYAIYSNRCIHRINAQVKDNCLALEDLVRRSKVLAINAEEINAHSSEGADRLFQNQAMDGALLNE